MIVTSWFDSLRTGIVASSRRTRRRRRELTGKNFFVQVQHLETKVMLSGQPIGGDLPGSEEPLQPIVLTIPPPSPPLTVSELEPPVVAGGPFPDSETFLLHSRPSATKTIYLDFNGHVLNDTYWNDNFTGGATISVPAFDFESGTGTFTPSEHTRIQQIWQRVAEAFSPFDVNVTTQEPPATDLRNAGGGDTRWGTRVAIGGDSMALLGISAGGIALSFGPTSSLTAFSVNWTPYGNADYGTTCFAFGDTLFDDEKYTTDATVHEVGHTLGLTHDGRTSPSEEYYQGHGAGATGWAPIMGVGYYVQLVQWSKGEYTNASNTQDDVLRITTANGFGYRPDDHGGSQGGASVLTMDVDGIVSDGGVIEQRTDQDWFSFTTAGDVNLTINPFERSAMLDILAELYDSGGGLVTSSNPTAALSATISTTVAAGTYYLKMDGIGKSAAGADLGYSDYGSLGQYTITGTIELPPAAGFLTVESGGTTSLSEHGEQAQKKDSFTVVLSTQPASDVVINVTSSDTGEATVSVSTLVFTPANYNTEQTVTVSGVFDNTADGNQSPTITLSIDDAQSDDAYDSLADQIVNVTVQDVANRPVVTSPNSGGQPVLPVFTWEDVVGETGYSLWLINKFTGTLTYSDFTIAANATSFSLPEGNELASGNYRFWINSISANGYSASGAPTDFAVGAPAVIPVAPTVTGTSDSGLGPDRPQIDWTSVPGAAVYGVYMINLETGAVIASQNDLTTNSFVPGTGLAESRYRIWVKASNAAGSSAWSTPFDFDVSSTTLVIPPTPAVTGTSDSGLGANRPQIDWTATSGGGTTKYGVYLINLDSGTLIASQNNLSTNSFVPSSGLTDGRYRIWVKAANVVGTSPWSTPFNFSIGTAPVAPPSIPTGFSASGTDTSTPTISWTASPGATNYAIWFVNLDTGALVSGVTNLTTNSFTPTAPLTNGRYRIFVRAWNSVGSSLFSSPFDFTVAIG